MSIVNTSSAEANESDFVNDLEFTIRLKSPLQNVVDFSLLEAVVPFTWYPMSEIEIHYEFTSMNGETDTIIIFAGHYTATELAHAITDYEVVDPDVIFGAHAALLALFSCTYDKRKDRFVFKNGSSEGMKLHFEQASAAARRIVGSASAEINIPGLHDNT